MNKKVRTIIFLFCICLYTFSGCNSKQINFNSLDSKEVDLLIKAQKINDRTLLINFGYDAVNRYKNQSGYCSY